MRWLLIFMLLMPFMAHAAQELPCEKGRQSCVSFKEDVPKYARCMALICLKAPEENKQQEASYDTCVKGAYKCAPLRYKPEEYWGCMRYECMAGDAHKVNRNCDEGKASCAHIVKHYYECATDVCKDKSWNLYDVCAQGQDECSPLLEQFWSCSQKVCLGDLKYSYKSPEAITAEREQMIIPYLIHAYKRFDENEDPAYRLKAPGGGPTRLLECPSGAYIMCKGNNWYSCQCSDGSVPKSATPHLIQRYRKR